MLSKSLKKASVLVTSGVLLGSIFSSNSWGMGDLEKAELPVEVRANVCRHFVTHGPIEKPDWLAIHKVRLACRAWKEGMDLALQQRRFLRVALTPSNYTSESLSRVAPLVSSVYLVGWTQATSRNIGTAVSGFSNLKQVTLDSDMEAEPSSFNKRLISGHIGIEGTKLLALALEQYPKLQSLYFVNPVGEESGRVFGGLLPRLPRLKYLEVIGEMGPIGTKYFVEGLVDHESLRTLILTSNNIGDIGAVALADKFPNLPQLATLHLDSGHKMSTGGKSGVVRDAGKDYLRRKAEEHLPSLKCSLLP